MMKIDQQTISRARDALVSTLESVPFLRILAKEDTPVIAESGPYEPDFTLEVELNKGSRWTLAVEVKANGEPRHARDAAQLLHYATGARRRTYGVFVAPYISERGGEICAEAGVGHLDLAGNCRLVFANVFIERSGNPNPKSDRRRLRSLFSPKSERVIRALLDTPRRLWKDASLSKEAQVSIGLVSKIKQLLDDREWIDRHTTGWTLQAPGELLALWRDNYRPGRHKRVGYYTMSKVEQAERDISRALGEATVLHALARFSAAARWAPQVLHDRVSVYVLTRRVAGADEWPDAQLAMPIGVVDDVLKDAGFKRVDSGANVEVLLPYDEGVVLSRHDRRGLWVTSAVQTYLDVATGGGRGEEAGEAMLDYLKRDCWPEVHNDDY